VALAHRPLHAGRAGLGGRLRFCAARQPSTLNPFVIPVPKPVVNFGKHFAIGRVLSVGRAGGAQARPSVRWGGLPGRRSHSRTTYWALGLISTVRIGAGAWPNLAITTESGDTDRAKTPIHSRQIRTQEQKENREDAFNGKTPGGEPRDETRLTSSSTTHRYRAARSGQRATQNERQNLTDI
jgi:hypothetical protein